MSSAGASLRVEHASVHFAGLAAVDAVSLDIAAGETIALVGPSGAGKSSLLRLLSGSRQPDEGRVLLDGSDLATLSRRALRGMRARVGFVHQDRSLLPNLRVVKNVLAGRLGQLGPLASMRSMLWPSRASVRSAYALLDRVGIGDKVFERTDRLSGGQQQRVAIARALYQDPRVLLADEPVSSVDPARAKDTIELLTSISREEGITLVASLHDVGLARAHFPRLVGMRRGRIAFDQPSADVSDAQVQALYRLDEGEMMADGA